MNEKLLSGTVAFNKHQRMLLFVSELFLRGLIELSTKSLVCPIKPGTQVEVRVESFDDGDIGSALGIVANACIKCKFGPNKSNACKIGQVPKIQ